MKKMILAALAAIAVIAAIALLRQPLEQNTKNTSKLKVAATIYALQNIAAVVGGERVDVVGVVPPGASPHTFEATPSTIRTFSNAAVVFAIGHELDSWASQITESIPGLETYVVDAHIALRPFEEEGEHEDEGDEHQEEEHEHGEFDPHYWLSIPNAKIIAANIAEKLAELDPEHVGEYRNNAHEYQAALQTLNEELSEKMVPYRGREIITFHDAWFYFAEEFGLEIAGVFVPAPGKEPSPQYLASLYRATEEHNIRAVFSEPGLSTETLEPFLADHGLSIRPLDHLEGRGPNNSFIEAMRYNVDTIITAFNE